MEAVQLSFDLFEEQRPCIWFEYSYWYGYPHCYLRRTYRFDCDECRKRGEQRRKEHMEKYGRPWGK